MSAEPSIDQALERPRAPAEPMLDERRFRVLVGLFAASGAAGLVDQVAFSKYLTYVVGSTAYAASAVLAAFMTGLALGAAAGGRLSAKVAFPVRAYGLAEGTVALAVVAAPACFGGLTPLYVALVDRAGDSLWQLSLIRWGLAALIVVVPTFAMGMTLPLVSPALGPVHSTQQRQRRLGLLYAANTFGGALGALGGAYLILPSLGISGTLYASAAVSGVSGVAALALAPRRARAALPDAVADSQPPRSGFRPGGIEWALLGALAFGSGFLVFTTEVVGTHLLAVIVGNSAYAFGLILAVFLICLFAGAAAAPWAARRFAARALPGSLALSGLALASTLPFWDDLPLVFGGLGQYLESFAARELVRGLVAFAILAVPVTLMGLTFPLILQRVAGQPDVGRLVGRLTASNTVGAVVGALAAGYIVLPWLGSEDALMTTALIFAAAAVLVLGDVRAPAARPTAVIAAAAALIALFGPRWRPEQLTAGTNVYFDGGSEVDDILYFHEDVHGGITTVTRRDGDVYTLYTNGKFQGNTGWEMNAQRYFAHYPSLFVDRFDRALVIGLGTGTTLGTLARYPWNQLTVVEISPGIIEASRKYFAHVNRNVLDDPRVTVRVADARNWLLTHQGGRYDLISMELSSVWFAGAANLYSREYYALVAEHLTRGGIFQQWVQLHHIYPEVFATLLNTLRTSFEHVALFYGGGQGILVSSNEPLRWPVDRAEAFSRAPQIAPTLPHGRRLETLAGDVLVVGDGLDRFVDRVAAEQGLPRSEMVSTDDNLYLEYATPRGNVLPWGARERLVAYLRRFRDPAAVEALAEKQSVTQSRGRDTEVR